MEENEVVSLVSDASEGEEITALRGLLSRETIERLQALDVFFGEIGVRAVLSVLIAEAYMDRLAALRDAEGE